MRVLVVGAGGVGSAVAAVVDVDMALTPSARAAGRRNVERFGRPPESFDAVPFLERVREAGGDYG